MLELTGLHYIPSLQKNSVQLKKVILKDHGIC